MSMKVLRVVLLMLLLAAIWLWPQPEPTDGLSPTRDAGAAQDSRSDRSVRPEAPSGDDHEPSAAAILPTEARDTLALIARGGPYPHRQDGAVFENRERRLPSRARGYYREFTVRTPGERTRGARRIVTGGDPPSQFWYTDDHYASFRRFEIDR
jgi:ribonuclease T1